MSKTYGGGRQFDTGATRDTADDKIDFEGCLSPLVLESFAQYMLRATYTDAGRRSSDNWQKGIPIDVYMKSLLRHTFELWIAHRRGEFNREAADGAFFNLQGFYHEHLKLRAEQGKQAAYEAAATGTADFQIFRTASRVPSDAPTLADASSSFLRANAGITVRVDPKDRI
jgi:hypothetical protein